MRASHAGFMFLCLALAPPALAGPGDQAAPVEARGAARVAVPARATPLDLSRYHNAVEVTRTRTPGKRFAVFHAQPRLLERGSFVLLEARSVAQSGVVVRWRCVARHDIAECLGRPLKLRYLPADQSVVLTAKVMPESELATALAVARADP